MELTLKLTNAETLQKEFFDHVWEHTKDEFLNSFIYRAKLTVENKITLKKIICILCKNKDSKIACNKIYKILEEEKDTDLVSIILQLIGSTRNKILTDLRSMLQSNKSIKVPTTSSKLSSDSKILPYAEKYLTDNMRRVFAEIIDKNCEVDDKMLDVILETLNQATWPGFIRQERAKRLGHYAEKSLAVQLLKLNIPFEPQQKAIKPISKDITIRKISYDLVIPNASHPKICFKSTVHTSNIGQYGESKDSLEIQEAKNSWNDVKDIERPKIMALIDGVGFKSNISGLKDILNIADEFCQFKTFWKVIIIFEYLTEVASKSKIWLPDPINHKEFLEKYDSNLVDEIPDGAIDVGEAKILKLDQ